MQRIRAGPVLLWLFFLVVTPVRSADGPEDPPQFKPEEIEALVAPIALYADPLLSQVLMASTYPLEVVQAARWVKANPNVKGDAVVKAVANQPWDASVKSLVAFPQILEPMNEKLDWTQKLGDAFLAQQQDVFAAVQRLRARARESGNLASNAQQNVIVEPAPKGSQTTVVRIESANPEVIYVPAYNPTVVYGAWSSPTYPPTYWPPSPAYYPGGALMTGFAWGVGLAAAGAIFSDCNWGGGDVDIDYNKVTNIDRNFDRSKVQGQGGRWQHDASHRQGVAYRDNATRQKFAGQVPGAEGRSQYRGRGTETATGTRRGADADTGGGTRRGADTAAGTRPGAVDRADEGNRATAADRGSAGNRAAVADRPERGNRATTPDRSAAASRGNVENRGAVGGPNRTSSGSGSRGGGGAGGGGGYGGGRDSAFTGVGAGGAATQRSYDRGRSSMQGSGFSRSAGGGGGMRGGGGRGGGGRR